MSVPYIYLECDNCNHHFINLIAPVIVTYHLEKDISIDLGREHYWCNNCNDITYCENLPLTEELEATQNKIKSDINNLELELESLEKEYKKRIIFKKKHLWKRINSVKNELISKEKYLLKVLYQIRWLLERESLPKCLSCGSTQIIKLEFVELNKNYSRLSNIKHTCGGNIYKRYDDSIRFACELIKIDVDSEGNVLL